MLRRLLITTTSARTSVAQSSCCRRGGSFVLLPRLRQHCSAAANGRAPQPPMPRVQPHASSSLSENATAAAAAASTTLVVPNHPGSSWRSAWQSGTILLTIGWSGLALLVVDRYLQYQQFSERLDAAAMVQTMDEEIQREKFRLHQQWKDHQPVLFHGVIRRSYKQMGGSHGLRGVDVGDVVEILDEGVGPDRAYNLCRLRGKKQPQQCVVVEDQIGWFPIAFMEKVPAPKERKSIWRRIFALRGD